jgi:hypothetical protein
MHLEQSSEPDHLVAEVDEVAEAARGPGRAVGEAIGTIVAIAGILMILGLIAGAIFGTVFLIGHSDPGDINPRVGAGYLDMLFVNRWVIWAARVVLYVIGMAIFAAALYIVMSIIVRISKGHWLRAGGGFQADTAAELRRDIDDAARLALLLDEAQHEKESLTEQLSTTTDALEEATEMRDWLLERYLEVSAGEDGPSENEEDGVR